MADTPETRTRSGSIQLEVRLRLLDEQGQPFMGIGLVWLLRRIDERRSIRQAAADMGMSYPKAIRILKQLEQGVGRPVLRRFKGGQERGGAELTAFAHEFLDRYEALQERIKQHAQQEYEREFAHLKKR